MKTNALQNLLIIFQGYYLYIESSGLNSGSKAQLISKSLPGRQNMCLRFFYSMKGKAIGSLKVLLKQKTGIEKEVFRAAGEDLSEKEWQLALVNVERPTTESKLIIQAEIGNLGPREQFVGKSDIAIDDVSLQMQRCNGDSQVGGGQLRGDCPAGIRRVTCRQNPCLYAQCPSSPYASCVPDDCGTCRAKFVYQGVEVLDCFEETCGRGVPTAVCQTNPCYQARCQDYPYAQCDPSFCGSCAAKFYLYGRVIPSCFMSVSAGKLNNKWSSWGVWSRCTKSCGSGTRVRYRLCNKRANSEAGCTGSSREMEVCNTNPCRNTRTVNGNWGSWSKWTSCTTTCDIGKRTRTRSCNNPSPSRYGQPCRGSSYMVASCLVKPCGLNTNFENGFAELKNVRQGDDMDWEIYRRGYRLEGNMPKTDHSNRQGAYVFLDGYRRQNGNKGRLVAPLMPAVGTGCLSFHYTARGDFSGHLGVIVRYFGVPKKPEVVFFKIINSKGLQNWEVGEASISSPQSTYQVTFEGAFDQIRDNRQRRRTLLLLDGVSLKKGKCTRSNLIESKQNREFPAHCIDKRQDCRRRARQGDCLTNREDMQRNCKRSCLCQGDLCTDSDTRCRKWSIRGECWANSGYMRSACCQSCVQLRVNCRDQNKNCGTWADDGECSRNPRYMSVYCRRSCNSCQ